MKTSPNTADRYDGRINDIAGHDFIFKVANNRDGRPTLYVYMATTGTEKFSALVEVDLQYADSVRVTTSASNDEPKPRPN